MKYLILALATLSAIAQTPSTMKDMQALFGKQRYREALVTAEQVKPSERTDEWEDIVAKSTVGYLKTISADTDREWVFEIGRRLIIENPHLEKNVELMSFMGETALRTFSTKGTAAPYLAASMKKDDAKCKDAEVQNAVSDAFVRPGFEREKVAAQKIAFELCGKALTADWAKSMTDSDHALPVACPGLLKANVLSGVKKKKYERIAK